MNILKMIVIMLLGAYLYVPAIPKKPKFDKEKLVNQIKSDLYTMYILEMAIVKINSKSMAQGKKKLKKDLETLYYQDFKNTNHKEVQQKLDTFCKTWKLDSIRVRDVA